MRILIHGLNFAPELVGVGKYTGEMAAWLAMRGHQVRVVTAPPFNPECRVATGYSPWRYSRESYTYETGGSLTVFRCPLWVPRKPSALTRLIHLASFANSSVPIMLRQIRWSPEVVLVIEPTLFCLPAARVCASWSGAISWLHIQDFEVDAAFELSMVKSAVLRRVVESLERRFMAGFERVSTISGKMMDRLTCKGIDLARQVLFENWVDTSQIYPLESVSPMRAQLKISEDAVVALYSGSMGNKQGLEIVVEAAQQLAGLENLHFVFCGEGPARQKLEKLLQRRNTIHLLPLQPLEKLNELLNLADIHLLPQRADAADLVMPSKLTGMFASGRAVIATAHAGTQLATVLNNRGIVVPPEDAAALASAIHELADSQSLRALLGRNAREYAVNQLEKNEVLGRFEQQLTQRATFSAASPLSGDLH